MSDQLEKFGLEYQFIEAVDKLSLRPEQYKLYNDEAVQRRVGRSLTDGEIACALSHIEAWKLAMARNIPHAVFLEDDAELQVDFPTVIQSLEQFPEQWNFLNFCTTAEPVKTGMNVLPELELVRYERRVSGTVAYCASRAGLEVMLQHVLPLKAAADGLLSSLVIMGHLCCYGTSPQIARPSSDFASSIWKN